MSSVPSWPDAGALLSKVKVKLEANILLADTELKAGIARNDTGRIRTAYHTLMPIDARLKGKPEYTESISVADVSGDKRFGWKEWTPQALHDRAIAEISERSKHDLIRTRAKRRPIVGTAREIDPRPITKNSPRPVCPIASPKGSATIAAMRSAASVMPTCSSNKNPSP